MAINRIQTTDSVLNRIQDNIVPAVNSLLACELFQGKLLEALAVTTSATAFNHTLGRKPKGFIVTYLSGNAVVYQPAAATETKITLQSSASVTINIWIF